MYKIIKDIKFEEFFYKIVGEKIDNYQITTGGNLNLPDSSFQDFHTDGFWAPRMFILNIATSKIDLNNGPMEVYEKSHQSFLPYWKFFFKKFSMKKKKFFLILVKFYFGNTDCGIEEQRIQQKKTENF